VSGATTVTVHPLVLLSVVDHYNRACKGTKNRAVGVLLGSWKGPKTLDISNSFAGQNDDVIKKSKRETKTHSGEFPFILVLTVALYNMDRQSEKRKQ
jgi:hypothetical protein